MDGRNHDDHRTHNDAADLTGAGADVEAIQLHDKLAADSQIGAGPSLKPTAQDQNLPSVALWQKGLPSESSSDIGPGFGWSGRYAENFDRDEPLHLDLAPILGLPQGTNHENLVLAAQKQEDELLNDLLK